MTKNFFRILLTLCGLLMRLSLALPLESSNNQAQTWAGRQPCTITALQSGIPSILQKWDDKGWRWKKNLQITVERADVVQQGIYPPELNWYGVGALNLPPVCAITVHIQNSTDKNLAASDYRLGMFLPEKWNGKVLTVGGGSFTGGIYWAVMGEGPRWGFATISTDTGHIGAGSDMSFATDQAKLYDWGYRALHGSVVAGKALATFYYGQVPKWSYYTGCSTGGRQGLREIQYDADSFDGALIGAPAWDTVHLDTFIPYLALQLKKGGGAFTGAQVNGLRDEVINQCDEADGLRDGIVSNPDACTFNFNVLDCSQSDQEGCLKPEQIAVIRDFFYQDYVGKNGSIFSRGFSRGSESEWAGASGFWQSNDVLEGFDAEYVRRFLNKTDFKLDDFTDEIVIKSENMDPGLSTAKYFDIRPFRDRAGGKGGKIIMYHGMADGLIPTKSSLDFYANTMKATGDTERSMLSWFRYFQVPGMNHCFLSGGQGAPWVMGGTGQAAILLSGGTGDGHSVPGHPEASAYDGLAALMDWVEKKTAPAQIIATSYDYNGTTKSFTPSNKTRPLCPFPQQAVSLVQDAPAFDMHTNWKCQG